MYYRDKFFAIESRLQIKHDVWFYESSGMF